MTRSTSSSLVLVAALAAALTGSSPRPALAQDEACRRCKGRGVARCGNCDAKGKVRCAVCEGRGRIRCATCRDGRPTCRECANSGHRGKVFVPEQRLRNPKIRTGNTLTGRVTKILGTVLIRAHWKDCKTCRGGKLRCPACKDRRRRTCGGCDGKRRSACLNCAGLGWTPDACPSCKGSGRLGGPAPAPSPQVTPAPPGRGRSPAATQRVVALSEGVDSGSRLLRLTAVRELGITPGSSPVAGLVHALRADDSTVTRYALTFLREKRQQDLIAEGGQPLANRLIELLEAPRARTRQHARATLAVMAGDDLGTRAVPWYRWSRRALAKQSKHRGASPTSGPGTGVSGSGDNVSRRQATVERGARFRSTIGEALYDAIGEADSRGLDVVLALDATSSMGRNLSNARQFLGEALALAATYLPNVHTGMVTYADKVTGSLQPSPGAAAVTSALARIEAKGGGDVPEAVDRALSFCVKSMKWRRKAARVVVVCGDAAPKLAGCQRAYEHVLNARRKGIRVHAAQWSASRAGAVDASSFFTNIVKIGGGTHLQRPSSSWALFDLLLRSAFRDPEQAKRVSMVIRDVAARLN